MTIVPVVDILDGQVVHAVAGDRKHYQPFSSSCFEFASPVDLIELWAGQYQSKLIYLADLNALQAQGNNNEVLSQLADMDVRFLLDAGFSCWNDFIDLRDKLPAELNWTPVFGTETIDSIFSFVQDAGSEIGNCFLSIDIKDEIVLRPKTSTDCASDRLEKWIVQVNSLGFRNIILLDLASVGTGASLSLRDFELPASLRSKTKYYAGGGVSCLEDVERYQSLGYSGVLVATALHSGAIEP